MKRWKACSGFGSTTVRHDDGRSGEGFLASIGRGAAADGDAYRRVVLASCGVVGLTVQELDRFLKKADKASKGEKVEAEEDFEKNKLTEDNIGFQMLKKAG